MRRAIEDVFLEATGGDDFVGVQCYTRMRVGPEGMLGPEEGVPVTQMGYEYWPQALEGTVRRAPGIHRRHARRGHRERHLHRPTTTERIAFVADALAGVRRCLADGIDVRGYFYWSLARQLRVGPRVPAPASGWSRSTAPPSSAGPSPARRGSGAVARANAG